MGILVFVCLSLFSQNHKKENAAIYMIKYKSQEFTDLQNKYALITAYENIYLKYLKLAWLRK